MRATVVSVGKVSKGSVLVTAVTSPSTTLEVDFGADFSPDGGQVTVAGHLLTYTGVLWSDQPEDGVTVDTLVLSGTAGFSAPKWTRVDVPGSVEYVAQVKPAGTNGVLTATLDHPFTDDVTFEPAAVSEGVLVEVVKRGRKFYLTELLNRERSIRPDLIAAGVLSASVTIPNLTAVPSVIQDEIDSIGGGSGSIGFNGGDWGDPYGPHSFDGGDWGDPYG